MNQPCTTATPLATVVLPLWVQSGPSSARVISAGHERLDGCPQLAVALPMVREGGVWFMAGEDGGALVPAQAADMVRLMRVQRCTTPAVGPAYTEVVHVTADLLPQEHPHWLIVLLSPAAGQSAELAPQQVAQVLADWMHQVNHGQVRQSRLLPALLMSPPTPPSTGDAVSFRMALASCQYPAGVLDDTPRQPLEQLSDWAGPADRSAMRLRDHCMDASRPVDLVILTGDQVYVDATAGVFNASPLRPQDPWDSAYRQRSRNLAWQALSSTLMGKSFVLLDDHEIQDNWYRQAGVPARVFNEGEEGVNRFRREQTFTWPIAAPEHHLWCDVSAATPWPVFLADTRSEREGRHMDNLWQAHIMSQQQRDALTAWIARAAQAGTPHFLVSSSAVLPRLRHTAREPAMCLYEDNWVGYPASLSWLLATLWQHRASNVVLLAGDEHVSSTCRIRLQQGHEPPMVVHAIHSSALYAPYPFANTRPQDFAGPDDRFELDTEAGVLQVHTHTTCYPGDGFAMLEVRPDGVRTGLDVSFVKGLGASPPPVHICW